jgi:hypothetical protein
MSAYRKAAIITILIFAVGILAGVWIDNNRLGNVKKALLEIDTGWDDARLLNIYFEKLGKDYCDIALGQNLEYNSKIYKEGLEIEECEDSNRFTSQLDITQEKRRYTLLQTQFWFNSIELKQNCNFTYHNVVHLLEKGENTAEETSQKAQSAVLLDLKEICGNKIMLIPLSADLDLMVIDTVAKKYNITEYPAIIIDETFVFQGLTSIDKLQEIVQC